MKKNLWIISGLLALSTFASANAWAADKPLFYADKNIVQTIPASTLTKVIFDVEGCDIGGTFDLAHSKWVPGQIGEGYISAAVYWTGPLVSGQAMEIHIFKNGTDYRRSRGLATGNGAVSSQITSYVSVTSITDYFEIYVYQNSASSENINDDWPGISWFSGQMIAATAPIAGDINGDGKVNLVDLAMLAQHWLEGTGQ